MKNVWAVLAFIFCIGIGVVWYMKHSVSSPQPLKDKTLSGWTIIIPGVTGDLAKRKLIPALYRLYKKGLEGIIIGTGRRDANIAHILEESKKFVDPIDESLWKQFSSLVLYHKLDSSNASDFKALADTIVDYEKTKELAGKRLVFLSLPADIFCPATRLFVESGIVNPDKHQYMLYEKPFGWDAQSAKEINACITQLLPDKQIYRVDHYVAKGTTQMIPYLPETNSLLGPVWNGKAIESVAILFHETVGIEGRGSFYDRYGAIKDVMQNHMLQLLAFFALDLSKAKTAQERAHQKATFLQSLSVRSVRRGQYEGYTQEKDVAPHSKTETYAAVTLESNDARWKGVPFFLETGKALARKNTEIRVTFRQEKKYPTNQLIMQFAPKELVSLRLNGLEVQPLELTKSDFTFPEAYEAILEDVLSERLRYSVSFEEVEAQWRLVDSILAAPSELQIYPKGKEVS